MAQKKRHPERRWRHRNWNAKKESKSEKKGKNVVRGTRRAEPQGKKAFFVQVALEERRRNKHQGSEKQNKKKKKKKKKKEYTLRRTTQDPKLPEFKGTFQTTFKSSSGKNLLGGLRKKGYSISMQGGGL